MFPALVVEKAAHDDYFIGVRYGYSVAHSYHAALIIEAISEAISLMPDNEAFNIWFEHVSFGTTSAINMRHDPETLANRQCFCTGSFDDCSQRAHGNMAK